MQGYPGFSGSAPTFTSFPGSFPSSTGFGGSAPFGSSFGGSAMPFGYGQSSFSGFPSSNFGTSQFAGFANNFSNALTPANQSQFQPNFFNQTPQFGVGSGYSQPSFGSFGTPMGQPSFGSVPGSAMNINASAPQGQAAAGGEVRGLPAAGSNLPFNLDSLNIPGSAMNSNFQSFQNFQGGAPAGGFQNFQNLQGSAMMPGSAMNNLALSNFGAAGFGGALPPASNAGFPPVGGFGAPSGAPLQGGFDFQQMLLQQQSMAAAAMGQQASAAGAQEYWEVQVPGTTDKWNRFPVASATELAQANAQGVQGTVGVSDDTGANWIVNVMARTAVSAADPTVSTLVKRTEVSAPAGGSE